MQSYRQIEIKEFATSSNDARYLLICSGQFYEANSAVVELLRTLQKYEKEEEGIHAYTVLKNNKYSESQVKDIIQKYINPILRERKGGHRHSFLYNREILSSHCISTFTDKFSFMFKPYCMWPIILSAIIGDSYFLMNTDEILTYNQLINIYMVAGLVLFMLSSSLFHEIGHASACKYLGVQHGGIGFGLYLNFPVLYTDVTQVWRLNRKQRCLVNMAGVYFQCIILILILVLFEFTRWDMCRYIIFTLNLGFLMTLNPFFKFDGYWLATDILGVSNLRQRTKEVWAYLAAKLSGKTPSHLPYLLRMKGWERYLFAIYTITVNLFMGYYFLYIIPRFLYGFIQSFPDEAERLVLYVSNNMRPPFALIRNIGCQLLFLILIGYMCMRLVINPVIKKYGKRKK
jgi:putative peptide zinc metalloprotease protein